MASSIISILYQPKIKIFNGREWQIWLSCGSLVQCLEDSEAMCLPVGKNTVITLVRESFLYIVIYPYLRVVPDSMQVLNKCLSNE